MFLPNVELPNVSQKITALKTLMSSHCQNQPRFWKVFFVEQKHKQKMSPIIDKFDSLISSNLFSSSALGLARF